MARSPFPKRRWLLPLLQGGLLLMLGIGLWALLTQPPHLRRTGPAQSVQEPTLHPADATKVFPLTRLAATKTAIPFWLYPSPTPVWRPTPGPSPTPAYSFRVFGTPLGKGFLNLTGLPIAMLAGGWPENEWITVSPDGRRQTIVFAGSEMERDPLTTTRLPSPQGQLHLVVTVYDPSQPESVYGGTLVEAVTYPTPRAVGPVFIVDVENSILILQPITTPNPYTDPGHPVEDRFYFDLATRRFLDCLPRDDFNRPDGPLGPHWSGLTHPTHLALEHGTLTARQGGWAFWNPHGTADPLPANQEACLTLARLDPGASVHLLLKSQSPHWTGAGTLALHLNPQSGRLHVQSFHPQTGWVEHAAWPLSPQPGDRLRARAWADGSLEVFYNDQRLGRVPTTPFFIGRGGWIGLELANAAIDNFGGGWGNHPLLREALQWSCEDPENMFAFCQTDDFEGEAGTFVGSAWTERMGDWGRQNGALLPQTASGEHLLTFNGWRFRDGRAAARLRLEGSTGILGLGIRLGGYGEEGRPTRGYLAEVSPEGAVQLWRVSDWTLLGQTALPGFTPGAWLTLGVEAVGTTMTVTVGGQPVLQAQDDTFAEGEVGIWSYAPPAPTAHLVDAFSFFPRQVAVEFPLTP
ncbi:MAG: hypothetical protein RQ897_14725 [Thermoflexus sp.]|nr:hypothetical protein [Thermoflexus sp.]MDT7949588.1 hypothetical protein [Thermoflexus sp.]